ncbi:MAG: GntR family transcriptional regulator [Acutalibacteraceae bacterium]
MFSIDFTSRLPIYEQLYNNTVRLISLGALQPGEKLPPVRTLASQLGVNPNTVAKAYQMLERDGVVYSVVGRGSFVSEGVSKDNAAKNLALEKLQKSVTKAMTAGATKEEIIKAVEKSIGTNSEVGQND